MNTFLWFGKALTIHDKQKCSWDWLGGVYSATVEGNSSKEVENCFQSIQLVWVPRDAVTKQTKTKQKYFPFSLVNFR